MSAGAPGEAGAFRALLRRHGIRPDRRLSQSFLFEPAALARIVAAAELRADQAVLEIGAGVGSLTRRLAAAAGRVVAIEVDRRLMAALREAVDGLDNVQVIEGDALALDLAGLAGGGEYAVVANIPYHITSLLIRRLLESEPPPRRLVLSVQREVAERVVAGQGAMSLLALGVQLYGAPRLAGVIPAGAFTPPPRVDSAVLVVDVHAQPRWTRAEVSAIFRVARAGFGQRRKQLRNALAAGLALPRAEAEALLAAADIEPAARAQELGLEAWRRLARAAEGLG